MNREFDDFLRQLEEWLATKLSGNHAFSRSLEQAFNAAVEARVKVVLDADQAPPKPTAFHFDSYAGLTPDNQAVILNFKRGEENKKVHILVDEFRRLLSQEVSDEDMENYCLSHRRTLEANVETAVQWGRIGSDGTIASSL